MRTIISDVLPLSYLPFEVFSRRVVEPSYVHELINSGSVHMSIALPTSAKQFWDIDPKGHPKWVWGKQPILDSDRIILLGSKIVEIAEYSAPSVDESLVEMATAIKKLLNVTDAAEVESIVDILDQTALKYRELMEHAGVAPDASGLDTVQKKLLSCLKKKPQNKLKIANSLEHLTFKG